MIMKLRVEIVMRRMDSVEVFLNCFVLRNLYIVIVIVVYFGVVSM